MTTTKVLGIGTYVAVRSPGTDTVMLKASGILPCHNYAAQLEKRPERVVPPMWSLAFFIEDVCIRAIKPFELTVTMNAGDARTLIVFDARGKIEVPIADPFMPASSTQLLREKGELFCVYARLPPSNVKLAKHSGCIVVPADSLVAAIYYKAFGPASRADCEAWLLANCGDFSFSAKSEGGSEVPWPIFKEDAD